MSRGLIPEVVSQLEGPNVFLEYLVTMAFRSATLRFWTGAGPHTYDEDTYTGNGDILSISDYSEDAGRTESNNVKILMNGISADLAYYALNEAIQSVTCLVQMEFFNSAETSIFVLPVFEGRLDSVDMGEDPARSTISFSFRDELARLKTEREGRWTPEEHKSYYPGDLGFDYVPFLSQQRIYWGRPDTTRQR